jgi:organic radical activating enzyme
MDMVSINNGEGFVPEVIRLFITDNCFYECDHCLMRASPKNSNVMSEAEITKYLEIGRDKDITYVSFTGGEPFMVPKRLRFGMEKARELGYETFSVESAFLGRTEKEIEKNAAMLAEFDAAYLSSIHVYQSRSTPAGFDYVQNKIASLRHLTEYGLFVSLIVMDVAETHETKALFDAIMKDGLNAQMIGFNDESIQKMMGTKLAYTGTNGSGDPFQINWHFQKVMKIGRAYDLGLRQREHHVRELGDSPLLCTLFYESPHEEDHDLDQLLVQTDGRVQLCCQQESDVDFGFGNLRTGEIENVDGRIANHPLLNKDFAPRLGAIRAFVEEQHPELVPEEGFGSGCDICNLFYRESKLREEVKEQLGIDSGLETVGS